MIEVCGATGLSERSEPICARCARLRGLVCCQLPADGNERLATLTFSDIERIEAATGMSRRRFCEVEQLDPLERIFYETHRPLYRGLFVGGVRHGLAAKRGACTFFVKGRGCSLPEEAKPIACKLYPFDFDLAGEVTLVDAPHCQALAEAEDWRHLLRLFGTSLRKLRRLRREALEEVALHAERLKREGVPDR